MKSWEFSRKGSHLFLVAKGSWGNLKVENRIPVRVVEMLIRQYLKCIECFRIDYWFGFDATNSS